MTLTPGARLGSYHIVSLIGAGGMGEVYHARDTRLNRDVAIKVLPEMFSQDPERLSRFQREAELLASVNHPNIAAIYGLETTEAGAAIVLELVDGQTLADVIARGAVPVDEALPIARAIADALEAAHERGIVHRDLKPANVKLTADGKVKVLDFGLAKMLGPPDGGPHVQNVGAGFSRPGASMSPTITTPAVTMAGVILGTAAYMSPEQARGKTVDRRADIWAFGCVLYEMLTGRQAFESGETVSDAIAAILKNDPDWSRLPHNTPPHIRTLLRRCLQKDPQKRLPHIGVARLEIDDGPIDAPSPGTSPIAPRPRWRRVLPIAGAVAIAIIVTFGLTRWMSESPTPKSTVTRFIYSLPEGQRFRDTFLPEVAISADGTQMAYVANQRLFVRSMSEIAARPIPGAEIENAGNIGNPVFSPDGQSIAYWVRSAGDPADMGTIKRVRLQGGTPVTIATVRRPLGMSWTGNDILVGQPPPNGVVRVSANGGMPTQIVSAKANEMMEGPLLLPGGDAVLFAIGIGTGSASTDGETWTKAQIVMQSLKSGERKTLIQGGSGARYLPTGHIVYAVGGVLMARTFDARARTVTGPAIPIVEGISTTRLGTYSTGSVQMGVSDTGSLVYVPGPVTVNTLDQRDLVIVDRAGTIVPLKLPPGMYEHPRVSPNGKQIAFDTDDGKNAIVWVYDLSGTTSPRQLTFEGRNRFPIWTPDGRRITFQSERDGKTALVSQMADGATPSETLIAPAEGQSPIPDSWTPDGKYLFFQNGQSVSAASAETQPPTYVALSRFSADDKKVQPFGNVRSVTSIAPIAATISPDGRWVAYTVGTSTNRASLQVYVQSLSGAGARYLIAQGAADPQWSPDGKGLFFLNLLGGGAFSTAITTQPSVEVGNPAALPMPLLDAFRRTRRGPGTPRNIDVLPDGQHFVAAVQHDTEGAGSQQIEIVLNWFEELKTRVSR